MSFWVSSAVVADVRVVGFIRHHAHCYNYAQLPNPLSRSHKMEGRSEMTLTEDEIEPSVLARIKEDEYESRSESENFEDASGDENDVSERSTPPRRKRKHRHGPDKIQQLEAFFKECPHPDDKQRTDLGRRLSLTAQQIKFWFQNRRTQMKTQLERHENSVLKQENEKLRLENVAIKDAAKNPICHTCGGPAMMGETSFKEHNLIMENTQLKEEVNRLLNVSNKFGTRSPYSPVANAKTPSKLNSNSDLVAGRNGFGGLSLLDNTLPIGYDMVESVGNNLPLMPLPRSTSAAVSIDITIRKSMLVDYAYAAMGELIKMGQSDDPLWIGSVDGDREILNHEEYMRTFPPNFGKKPSNFVTEVTRETSIVFIDSMSLVETLMDSNHWKDMFPCIIGRAATLGVISSGTGGTLDGAIHMVQAELQVLSPMVPLRLVRFLRFSKQHGEGLWAVVDVSIDALQGGNNAHTFLNCRRLPSGCLMQDLPNGYCKVTWIEHADYDESAVHHLYRKFLSYGMGFGARRWLAALQRQCDSLAIMMSSTIPLEDQIGITSVGMISIFKLAQRMTDNFCSGVCGSSARSWEKLHLGKDIGEDVSVMARKSLDDPGEPGGIVLSATKSVWMRERERRVFDYLRDEWKRGEWDVLSNGDPMQKVADLPKGEPHKGNSVTLLRVNAKNSSDKGMLVLQETWIDSSGSLVVYAPVDLPTMHMLMSGGNSSYVALLPSGFAIVPDGGLVVGSSSSGSGSDGGGCLLTVGFQILVNTLPTARLTMESIETMSNLISCTIQKIKAGLAAA